ncbi:MAG: hypothetical protein GY845_20390 [Planctomycetes bacterium]|nr:hypothetical protein [Planctomycetota bacterium]
MTESEIINRLHKLEKQNKYMKLGGLAIVLLVVTTLLTGASKKPDVAEEIRAKKIVLVNERGKDVIVMENLKDSSQIVMFDSKANERLSLSSMDSGPLLYMYDSKGKKRLSLSSSDDDDNGGCMAICNKKNETVVQLSVDEYGNGKVGAYNRKGMGRELTPEP